MSQEKDIAKHYKRKQIESSSPGKLIVMLYEKAIEHLDNAEEAINGKNLDRIESFHNSVITCQNIITELTVSLDIENGGDVANNLFRLYDFMNYRLVDSNIRKDTKALDEVRGLLKTLKSGWEQVQDAPIPEDKLDNVKRKGFNIQG
jgi:flagellar secretion chaperone FliS